MAPTEGAGTSRVPPHSLEAETSVLGAILLNNEVLPHVTETIEKEDFYRGGHQLLFKAMTDLFATGAPIDLVTVAERLKSENQLDKVGGAAYISSLTNQVPSVENAAHYAVIIKELAVLRRMIWAATEVANEGYDAASDVPEYLDRSEQAIFNVSSRQIKPSFTPIKEILTHTFEKIEELYDRRDLVTGVSTGFADLDKLTAGLQKSDLVIVAGRPGMGKTSFMLNVAQHATKNNVTTLFFSLEMSKEQLVMRMLSSESHVDSQRLRRGNLSQNDWPKLTRAAGTLAECPIYIDDTPAITPIEVRAKARRLASEQNLGLVVVDYLQLMRAKGKHDMREQEISEISRSLKALAKEVNVPVVALSQLNRNVENRAKNDRRPQLADLRESGAIEQDADMVMFVYRDEVYNEDPDNVGKAEIIVEKARHGPTGIVELAFQKEFTRFENLARGYETDMPIGE